MIDPAFDEIAEEYDAHFTHSTLGKLQRDRVWKYMSQFKGENRELNILELNCGTGEDALFLARQGHNVLATDVASNMLKVIQDKIDQQPKNLQVHIKKLDLKNLEPLSQKFDLIFSNFGGINCLNENQLIQLAQFASNQLTTEGHCIFVVMPQETLVEKWYRIFKNQKQLFRDRKLKEGIEVRLIDQRFRTYYYNDIHILNSFQGFYLVKSLGIGYIPSYFNASRFVSLFKLTDNLFNFLRIHSNYSDHYLIHLIKK